MERLREAGFSPLEVIHSATMQGARQIGIANDVGSVQVGKKPDLVVTRENPPRLSRAAPSTPERAVRSRCRDRFVASSGTRFCDALGIARPHCEAPCGGEPHATT
jgi:cytosine/adenosine deaminase-related metal-dependent hydrolase